MPDTDEVISVTREESATISAPGNGDTFGITSLSLTNLVEFRTKFINQRLVFQIPNLDGGGSGSTQPVTVGGEGKSVDNITSFQRVQVLGVVQIPKHDNTILTGGSTEGTIGRNSDSVDITVVTNEVGAKLELGKIPDLDDLVPTTRDDDRVGRVGGETNARDPVAVTIFGQLELAFTKSVPQLDGLVTGTRDDLTVISGEADGQDITSVTNETAGGGTGVKIPQTEGLIPRGGKSELTVGGDSEILNEVVVTQQGLAGNTIVHLVTIINFYKIHNNPINNL